MRDEYNTYFQQLLEGESVAAKVPFREVQLNGWEPRKGDCHGNVDFWIRHHPETKAVRGWLFWKPDAAGRYLIMAHSVLDENGQLVDITPIDQNAPRDGLLFLKHLGTEEDFSAMKISCSQVFYPPVTFNEWQESQVAALGEATNS